MFKTLFYNFFHFNSFLFQLLSSGNLFTFFFLFPHLIVCLSNFLAPWLNEIFFCFSSFSQKMLIFVFFLFCVYLLLLFSTQLTAILPFIQFFLQRSVKNVLVLIFLKDFLKGFVSYIIFLIVIFLRIFFLTLFLAAGYLC